MSITCNATTFTIGGAVSGLTASGLVLQNNGSDDLEVLFGATSFEFITPVAYDGGYSVTVAVQPTGLTCTVNNGTGTNVTANVNNVRIICNATTFSVGGTISGLTSSGLVLQNNGTDYLPLSSGDTFFEFTVAYGSGYNVTVAAQPEELTCTVNNGAGMNVTTDVTDVQVVCDLAVGDALGGGVIYKISGPIAYVVSLVDVSASEPWDVNGGSPISVGTSDFDGYSNTYTTLIDPNFMAAAACRNYAPAGEWFLPARAQWAELGDNATLTAIMRYFTSATNSDESGNGKGAPLRVRCVRTLTI